MPFQFNFHLRGYDEVYGTLFHHVPKHLRGVVSEAASDDLIGTPQRGLQRYPPYKHIARSSVFRPTFKSDKQRRFVMASIRSGSIEPGYPHRTGNYQRSWQRVGSGVASRIQGQLPHEGWPNPLAKRIGWREPLVIIMSNLAHATQAAERAVAAWFKARGL
jgi:hypothetical protein